MSMLTSASVTPVQLYSVIQIYIMFFIHRSLHKSSWRGSLQFSCRGCHNDIRNWSSGERRREHKKVFFVQFQYNRNPRRLWKLKTGIVIVRSVPPCGLVPAWVWEHKATHQPIPCLELYPCDIISTLQRIRIAWSVALCTMSAYCTTVRICTVCNVYL